MKHSHPMLNRSAARCMRKTMLSFLRFLLVIVAATAGTLFAGDQRGTENTKHPVSAEILAANAAKASSHPINNPDPIGNVQVTYADGTKDLWTTKGDCSLARVGSDGTVGWTVNGSEVRIKSGDWVG